MAGGSIMAEFHGRGTYFGTSQIHRETGRYDLPPLAEEEQCSILGQVRPKLIPQVGARPASRTLISQALSLSAFLALANK